MAFLIWIILAAIIALAIIMFLVFKFGKGKKHEPDYRTFFIIGLVFFVIGLPTKNYPLFILGLAFLGVGLVNKKKWKKQKNWKQLSKKEKQIKLLIFIGLGVLIVLGLIAYLIQSFRVN